MLAKKKIRQRKIWVPADQTYNSLWSIYLVLKCSLPAIVKEFIKAKGCKNYQNYIEGWVHEPSNYLSPAKMKSNVYH
jgi:hypothetical protein